MDSAYPPGSGKNAKSTEKPGFKVTDGGKKGTSSGAPSDLSGDVEKYKENRTAAGVPFVGKAFSFYHGEYKEGLRSGEMW